MTTATATKRIVYESAQTVQGSPMRRLSNNEVVNKPARALIPNRDKALIGGKLVEISYIKGATTHLTKEQREQGLIQKDDHNVEIFPDFIEVINGFIKPDEGDECLCKFLEDTRWNGSNPNRPKGADILFYVREPAKEAEKALTLRKLRLKAEHAVMFELNDNEVISLAKTVTDKNNRPLNLNQSTDELRVALAEIAKYNPDAIMNGATKNDYDLKQLVLDAVDAGIIKVGQGGIYKWDDGEKKGTRVCTMGAGLKQADRINVLVTYLISKEGEQDLALTKTLLENKLATETV